MEEFRRLPFRERVKKLCGAWAVQGYGTPVSIIVYYTLKVVLAIWAWNFFCSFSPALGTFSELANWIFQPDAIAKMVLTAMLYESLGLGCGSGPMTSRFIPPVTAPIHFLWPGTIRLPAFPNLPLFKGDKRSIVDVLLYAGYLFLLLRVLIAPVILPELILPIVILLPLIGLRDKTIFLNARSEHYLIALICFLFPEDSIAGLKWVWFSIWFWAATSKLNKHFPSVISVMISNSAVIRSAWIRKQLYKNYPDDLHPSRLTQFLTHFGTLTEYTFPILLMLSSGGNLTLIALAMMIAFHTFISMHLPMATPILWNVVMVTGGFILFGYYPSVSPISIQSTILIAVLFFALVIVPLIGNFFPKYVSFLMSMRYYAGNWAYSIWLFKNESQNKLDAGLTKCSPSIENQISTIYNKEIAEAMLPRIISFRCMHLHGRILQKIIPNAVENIDDYAWLDGELIAGLALGWNFGEGHLHDEQLLNAIQKRCNYESGELRVVMVESQPLFNAVHRWRVVDAHDGEMQRGETRIAEVIGLQPWEEF